MTREQIHTALRLNEERREGVRADVHADVLAGRSETPAILRMRGLMAEDARLENLHAGVCLNVHGAPVSA